MLINVAMYEYVEQYVHMWSVCRDLWLIEAASTGRYKSGTQDKPTIRQQLPHWYPDPKKGHRRAV